MKYPEYDSPFKLIVDDFASAMAKQIDDDCWQAVQKVGIGVDRETLIEALKQDSYRYREAFQKGYETGYAKRDDEIVRCKDCKHGSLYCICDDCGETLIKCNLPRLCDVIEIHRWEWFCADGERKDNA